MTVEKDNEQKLVFSGATLDEALRNARDKLGVEPFTELTYKIIEDSSKKKFKLFGHSKREVRVEISFGSPNSAQRNESGDESHDVKKMVADIWKDPVQHPPRMPKRSPSNQGGARKGFRPEFVERQRFTDRYPKPTHDGKDIRDTQVAIPDDVVQKIQGDVNSLFQKMGFGWDVSIEKSIKNPSTLRINSSEEGKKWLFLRDENLRSVEEILIKLIKTKYSEEYKPRIFFVGGRIQRQRRVSGARETNDMLREEVERAIKTVRESGKEIEFGPLNAFERRLVHKRVAEESDLESRSSGEGHLKKITIYKNS